MVIWVLIKRSMELYELNNLVVSLLNLKSDEIERIDNVEDKIFVYLKRNKDVCPICGSNHIVGNGYYSRVITLPNDSLSAYVVKLYISRNRCVDCYHSFSDSKDLSPANKKISYKTIFNVMEMLKSPRCTFKDCAKANGISPSSIVRIFDEHCHIDREKLPEVLCMDEVYVKSNDFDAKYSCILYDFYKCSLIDVTPSRKQEYLHMYFSSIPKEERDLVKYVCIDMYVPYKQIIKQYLKKANICVDSFHVVKTLNEGLKKVRIRVMKKYDHDSIEYYLLKTFNFLLMDRTIDLNNEPKYNKKLERYINYNGLLELILSIDDDLALAYNLKEEYTIFNLESSIEEAASKYDEIRNDFIKANIKEYKDFNTILKNWKTEIINSFTRYKGRRINNGVAEGLNSTISTLLFNTRGIKNNKRRRKRILYAINKKGFKLK